MQAIEIERRFLCGGMPPDHLEAVPIVQGYLSTGSPSVRIRETPGGYVQTVKGRGFEHEEVELTLPDDVGQALLRMCGDRLIRKTRYLDERWEIDVFHGPLEELIIAEVELSSATETLPTIPDYLHVLRELTGMKNVSNKDLSLLKPKRCRKLVRELYAPFRESEGEPPRAPEAIPPVYTGA